MANILVIDDEPAIAELVRSVLADAGHRATLSSSLEGVLESADPDLVVTDLLTSMEYRADSARAWIAAVRKRFPGKPVVVCTAHKAATQESDRLGADVVIAKPFDVDDLSGTVDRLLAA